MQTLRPQGAKESGEPLEGNLIGALTITSLVTGVHDHFRVIVGRSSTMQSSVVRIGICTALRLPLEIIVCLWRWAFSPRNGVVLCPFGCYDDISELLLPVRACLVTSFIVPGCGTRLEIYLISNWC